MKVKHIPLKRLIEIRDEGFTGANGRDFWDYQDQILERIWQLQDRMKEKEFKKKMEEEELYNLYHFELEEEENISWLISNFNRLMEEEFYSINNFKNNLT